MNNAFFSQGDINDVPLHQKKTVELLTSKTGGAYIPPAKLRMMQESITDKSRCLSYLIILFYIIIRNTHLVPIDIYVVRRLSIH